MKSPASCMALKSMKSSDHSHSGNHRNSYHRNSYHQYQNPKPQGLQSSDGQALANIYNRGIQLGVWAAVLTFIFIAAW